MPGPDDVGEWLIAAAGLTSVSTAIIAVLSLAVWLRLVRTSEREVRLLIERRSRLRYLAEHPDQATPEDKDLLHPNSRA